MIRGTLILILSLACSASAFAQVSPPLEHREWEATGYAGYTFPREYRFQTTVSGGTPASSRTVGMHYDSAYQVGIRVSQNLENSLIADMEYSFSNQPLRFTNLAPDIPSLSVSHFLHNVNYNVSYSPSTRDSRFRPYVGAGVGAAWFQVAGYSRAEALALGVGLRDSWEFVVNWGGGFKYLLKDHVAVTFDVKDRLSRVPSYNLPVAAKIVDGQYVPGVAVHGLSQVWQLNWGFTYQYDRW